MQTPGRSVKEIILILAAFMMLTGCRPDKYSGGSGTRIDPYKIAEADDLLELAAETNDYDAHFILTADIDLNPNLAGGQFFLFAVIANDINNSGCKFDGVAFTGVFDGAGHKITNLTINTCGTGNDYLGLFGQITCGQVKNLCLENINIRGGRGSSYIGGLAGYSHKSGIKNCSVTGKLTSRDNSDSIGGIVGDNCFSRIIGSCSICDVRSGAYSSNLGGLAGGNIGTIQKCKASGTVTGGNTSMWLGGLVGSNSGAIRDCFSTGIVAGGEYSYNLGALAGDSPNGTIINCHSTTKVEVMILNTHRSVAWNK